MPAWLRLEELPQDGLWRDLSAFLEWMQVRAYSERTMKNRRFHVGYFIEWSDERGITRASDVTKPILERYQRFLFYAKKKDGQPLSFRTQNIRLQCLQAFFKWLTKSGRLDANPASELDLPRVVRALPRVVLTADEVEQVLAVPDVNDLLGLRDRAILETLYATGMRRSELTKLDLYDVHERRGCVVIKEGKGRRDRVIPISERALSWIRRYLDEVRPKLLLGGDEQALFLTQHGVRLDPSWLSEAVSVYVTKADIGKKGSCHLFRHTMATLMLENGADIRFIQAMLGHSDLSTTQIYTHVAVAKLREVYAATHPAGGVSGEVLEGDEETRDLFAALDEDAADELAGK